MQTLEDLHNHYKQVRQRIQSAKPIVVRKPVRQVKIIHIIEAAELAAKRRAEEELAFYEEARRKATEALKPSRYKLKVIEIAKKHGIEMEQMVGECRAAKFVKARQEAMYELHMMGLSYPSIGRLLGGRDHTTCLHGMRKHKKYLASIAASEASGLRVDTGCQLPTRVEAVNDD